MALVVTCPVCLQPIVHLWDLERHATCEPPPEVPPGSRRHDLPVLVVEHLECASAVDQVSGALSRPEPEAIPWYHTDGRPGLAVVHGPLGPDIATFNRHTRKGLAAWKGKGVGRELAKHRRA